MSESTQAANMDGIAQQIRKLNFTELIQIDPGRPDPYTFDHYEANGFHHPNITGYCISCEEQGRNQAIDAPGFQLRDISHGTHAYDFFQAMKRTYPPSELGWHSDPIIFVYETPARDSFYDPIVYRERQKRPSGVWYWIHDSHPQHLPTAWLRNSYAFPLGFRGRTYGEFVISAAYTFKLTNFYMTNLVKCGMNNEANEFKNIQHYRTDCIDNCYQRFLSKELDILQPRLIFAVGASVAGHLRRLTQDRYFIQPLLHPASARQGIRDEYFKVLNFWLVLRALHKTGVILQDEVNVLTKLFLDKYEDPSYLPQTVLGKA